MSEATCSATGKRRVGKDWVKRARRVEEFIRSEWTVEEGESESEAREEKAEETRISSETRIINIGPKVITETNSP